MILGEKTSPTHRGGHTILNAGTGYAVSPTRSAATVSVADNDVTPQVSITAAGGVTEGANAAFTVTVTPAPAAALTVKLNVSQSGSYIASGGAGCQDGGCAHIRHSHLQARI